MRWQSHLAGFLLSLCLATGAAGAQENRALSLYEAGDYAAAVEAGRAAGDASGLALAARARLVLVRFFDPPDSRLRGIEVALSDARQALALEPDHLEGNLQTAVGLGYRGRLNQSANDARLARQHINHALLLEPENAWALAAMGGWHAEIVLEAGAFFGRIMFGARRSLAIENFRAAIVVDPDNPAIRVGFAKVLLRFGKHRYRAEATTALTAVGKIAPRQAFDEMMQQQGRQLLAAIEAGDEEGLQKLLKRMALFSAD